MSGHRIAPSSPPKGKGARRRAAVEAQRTATIPSPPVSGVPVRSALPGSVPRTRRHSSTAATDCAHFHRQEVPAGGAASVSTTDTWEQAAPPVVGFKRVPLETFHSDITDPNREQNLVSLLMTEIAAHQTDASRFLRGANETEDRVGKRSRCSLWVITVFIYLVQIGAACKLLGNGRSSSYDTTALVATFTEGLGNIYNLTALNSALNAAGDAGQPGLLAVFDSSLPVERQFSEATIQSIMMLESSNLQKEQLMNECHAALVDTHHASAAACDYKLSVCNTYKGVLNKLINMFAGGFVICGIVFHELFGMLTMEYPVVLPASLADGESHTTASQPPAIKHIWVLCMFLTAHLCLVITCVTACMVRVYGMGNDFWSVIESIVAAFLILDIDDKALAYIKSRVLARARGGRRRLVLSKIKKSVNLVKAANMFRPRPSKITKTSGLLHSTNDDFACVGHRGHKSRVATDLDLLSAELGLVSSSGCGLPPLEQAPQLRTAVDCTSLINWTAACDSTIPIDRSDNVRSAAAAPPVEERLGFGSSDTTTVSSPSCCCHGCCDDLPIRRRMCVKQLHRDAESCRRCGRWIYRLFSCKSCRINTLLPFPTQNRSSVPPPSMLEETYITYYTIGVRGDSRLSLLYLAQLLFASPIMWSCWNACVDVDVDHPWVKRAAFITTWWMTPATTAMALTSVAWQPLMQVMGADVKIFWPALLCGYGRGRFCRAAGTLLTIVALWCGTFWVSATHFSAWFAAWV